MTASPTPIRPAATDLPWFSSWWGSLFCCLFSYLSLLYIYSGCEKASLHNGLGRIRSEWSGSPVFFEINHLTNEKEELSCSPKKEAWITLRALYPRQELNHTIDQADISSPLRSSHAVAWWRPSTVNQSNSFDWIPIRRWGSMSSQTRKMIIGGAKKPINLSLRPITFSLHHQNKQA